MSKLMKKKSILISIMIVFILSFNFLTTVNASAMTKVMIDAGHGGRDSGAIGNGLKEKDINLVVAKVIDKHLNDNYEVETKMTRTTDVYLSLEERSSMANKWGADFFFSTHVNAGGGTGYEDYIYNGTVSQKTKDMQDAIHSEVMKTLDKYGVRDRGKKENNFHVLRETNMPAVLAELMFIDNSTDAKLLKNSTFLNEVGVSYAEGIAKGLELPDKIVNGTVTIKHQDTKGNSLSKDEKLTGKIGDKYTAKEKIINGYVLDSVKGNKTGSYTSKAQTVTFVYKEEVGTVVVKHEDANGKELAKEETLTGQVGKGYTVNEKMIEGYVLDTVKGNKKGSYTSETQTVTFVYEKQVVKSSVIVKYVDQNGKELAKQDKFTGNAGDKHNVKAKDIAGYKLINTDDDTKGIFGEDDSIITFTYAENAHPVNVDINWVDKANTDELMVTLVDADGKMLNVILKASEHWTGEFNVTEQKKPEKIKIEKVDVSNDYNVSVTGDAVNGFNISIELKESNVVVKHIDAQTGKEIADTEVLTGKIGTDYETEVKNIDGYNVIVIPDNYKGTFINKEQSVVYEYKDENYVLPELISIDANVIWKGKNESYIMIHLLANGKEGERIKLSDENGWKYSFENLPKYDEEGRLIRYEIATADNYDRYDAEVTGDVENGFTITLTDNVEITDVPSKPDEDTEVNNDAENREDEEVIDEGAEGDNEKEDTKNENIPEEAKDDIILGDEVKENSKINESTKPTNQEVKPEVNEEEADNTKNKAVITIDENDTNDKVGKVVSSTFSKISEGKPLPDTATDIFNMVLIGLVLLGVAGGSFFYIRKLN